MPIIIHPVYFTLIFGGIETSLPNSIYGLGLLHMLGNTLSSHQAEKERVVSAEVKHVPSLGRMRFGSR
jgi:hypothetical protein